MKARRSSPRRVTGRDHGEMESAWQAVWVRQRGRCWLCRGGMTDAHHRQTSRLGPDCPANLLGLCSRCHHDTVHGHPEAARIAGWIVSRYSNGPCGEPVQGPEGLWWVLGCDGSLDPMT